MPFGTKSHRWEGERKKGSLGFGEKAEEGSILKKRKTENQKQETKKEKKIERWWE